eukprot:scaffold7006_cov174-Skeletonema_marinoi.AAC.49
MARGCTVIALTNVLCDQNVIIYPDPMTEGEKKGVCKRPAAKDMTRAYRRSLQQLGRLNPSTLHTRARSALCFVEVLIS